MKIDEINEINYSEFVGFVKERNRPSGGIKTVQRVAVNAFINHTSKVLEIGSNTGFTSVNLSLLTGCSVVGIDPIDQSVEESRSYATKMKANKVKFQINNALNLPFEDGSFDAVWASNVTSFIEDKETAIKEYFRVLKPNGFLIVVPIYYADKPPESIVNEVSKAIGANISIWDKDYWINLFSQVTKSKEYSLEKVYDSDFRYLDRKQYIKEYTEMLINKDHLGYLNSKEKIVLRNRSNYFIELFNNNLKYAGYSIILFQKRSEIDEEELFLTKEVTV